jgi:hypothetical protein
MSKKDLKSLKEHTHVDEEKDTDGDVVSYHINPHYSLSE